MEIAQENAMAVNVLKEFTNAMPPKLPMTLPPRRGVDYCIEPGVNPPI